MLNVPVAFAMCCGEPAEWRFLPGNYQYQQEGYQVIGKGASIRLRPHFGGRQGSQVATQMLRIHLSLQLGKNMTVDIIQIPVNRLW
jgi:hypothetical protein